MIAGTGTINRDGEVGDIGGIDKKVVSAAKSGASIFFAPVSYTHLGHTPAFQRVVKKIDLNEKWSKRSAENSEFAIMKTFQEIEDNLLRNIEVLKQ